MADESNIRVAGRCDPGRRCASRRDFLIGGGAATSIVLLKSLFPGRVAAADGERRVRFAPAPRARIAALSELQVDRPVPLSYPRGEPFSDAMLVKLGVRAGGGVGPDQDVVAFSTWCTHMGGDMSGEYNARYKVAGPCREHLTTFDLTRHGMVVAGHATEALPQVVLELDGDDIHAVGIIGLLYGYHANPTNMKDEAGS